jgi:DNA invertase Pin-like site-specific DNA recombinase
MGRVYKSKLELEQEQRIALGLVQPTLPTHKLLLIYGRQSLEKQRVEHKESARQQAVELLKRGRDLGWLDENIHVLIENVLMKNIASVSGSLRIDERPGLQNIVALIESGKVGAVLVRSEDRLFRDPTQVQSSTFADLCKRNHVLIITLKKIYDFNHPIKGNDDYNSFLDAAREAAKYVETHIKGDMLGNRLQKAMRGEYAGHTVPTGLMLDDARTNYVPNQIWAPVIKGLFKRFRQLDADHAALRREIAGKPIFPELPDDIKARVGHITLTKVEGGYTLKSRTGLAYLLTNPAYIGHTYYKGHLIRNTHAPIVDEDDFMFAFNHLSDYTLDGEPIERPKRAVRYEQRDNPRRKALFDGVRPNNGEPVITCPGKHVYVYQQSTTERRAIYVIKDTKAMRPEDTYVASIQVKDLDAIFTDRLLSHLKLARIWHFIRTEGEKAGSVLDFPNALVEAQHEEYREMSEHFLALQQEVQASLVSVDTSIENTNKRIAVLKRDLHNNPGMAQEDRDDIYADLKKLRAQLADLQNKKSREQEVAADIQVAKDLMFEVEQGWEKMIFEKQQRFVRISTKKIMLESVNDGWMKLTVQWSPVLRLHHYDIAYIWRQAGSSSPWSKEEIALVKEHYGTAKRSWLLAQLPKRTWAGFKAQALRWGIHRPLELRRNDSGLPDWMCMDDQRVMLEYGLELEEPGQRVWWKEEMALGDAGSNGEESSGLSCTNLG